MGDTYDPVTTLSAARHAAALAKNRALVTSVSWGHTAYGTSTCATRAVDVYLLTGKATSKTCVGDYVPFANGAARVAQATVVQKMVAAAQE